ncbi:MAG: PEP-CTERM sorting domain-containing protein [Planctomycetota bacterium]
MKKLLATCIVLAMAASASAAVQLDISSGFNMDAWCGAKEYQVIQVEGCDLAELQGGNAQGVGWYVLGQQHMMIGNTTEGGFGEAYSVDGVNWYHPAWYSGNEGTPEDGLVTGADRQYHIASHLGNATLPGDWLEADPPGGVWQPGEPEEQMANKANAMVVASSHDYRQFQIAEAVAMLPVEQQAAYTDINVIIGGWNAADPNMHTDIYAVYADGTEDLLYSFTDDDGGQDPVLSDDKTVGVGGADFAAVYSFTHSYNSSAGSTGSVSTANPGTLYEFASPLPLDSAKVLAGVKMVDSDPTNNWDARGTSIFAATAIPEPATLALLGLGALGLIRRRNR